MRCCPAAMPGARHSNTTCRREPEDGAQGLGELAPVWPHTVNVSTAARALREGGPREGTVNHSSVTGHWEQWVKQSPASGPGCSIPRHPQSTGSGCRAHSGNNKDVTVLVALCKHVPRNRSRKDQRLPRLLCPTASLLPVPNWFGVTVGLGRLGSALEELDLLLVWQGKGL